MTTDPFAQGDLFDPTRIAWIWDADNIDTLIREIHRHPFITLDIEGTGLDEHATEGGPTNGGVAARVALLQLTLAKSLDDLDPVTWLVPLSHKGASLFPQWVAILRRCAQALLDSGADLTGHNGRFDCRWIFAATGVDLTPNLSWDTMVVEHLLDENTTTKLKVRASRRFGVERWDDIDLSTPGAAERVPLLDLGLYGARDTYWTWRLRVAQQHELWLMPDDEPDGTETDDDREMIRLGSHVEFCVMPMVRNLAAVEQRGFRLDQEWVADRLGAVEEAVVGASAELSGLYELGDAADGLDVSWAPTSNWFRAWTDAAVAARGLRIDSMTAKGRPQWNSAVLKRQQREGNEVAGRLLELRQAAKQGEFLRSWQELVTPASRIHASYNVGRVSTGRLSSCVSADTLIDMPRDMVKYPEGVPITEVKAGDWVYSFDWKRELTLRQVEWVGPTKVAETVVVTFENSEGHQRTLRCTPDHLIRLRNGDWRAAGSLLHLWGRGSLDSEPRVLSMVRRAFDEGYFHFFPHSMARGNGMSGGGRNKEHRWVAGQVRGLAVSSKTDVHHEDGTKINNHPSNLRALSIPEHRAMGAKHHARWGEKREEPITYCGPSDYRVVSVEPGPVEEVWDMTVPEDHQFVANGIVVHNSDPNLQQVTKKLKPAFVPDPGMLVVELDYSQIELRVAAFIARSQPMLDAYARGDDLHRLMAAQITGKDPVDVTPDERQRAKASNFGLLYMQTPEGFQTYAETAYGVVLTLEQAYESYEAFFSLWDGMAQWHQSVINTITRDGQIVSPLGRVRRVPNALTGDPYLVSEAARQACNAPVQSFASDVMQVVAADIGGQFGNPVPDVQMVSTVHDSIVVQVPADDWRRAVARTMQRMINPHHLLEPMGCYFDVPLGVEATVSSRWGLGDIAVVSS